MKFNDAFYRGFGDEIEELQKEAAIPLLAGALTAGRALLAGGRVAGAARGIGTAARAAGGAASKAGGGLWSKIKGAAGTAAQSIPFMGGGGGQSQQKKTSYV